MLHYFYATLFNRAQLDVALFNVVIYFGQFNVSQYDIALLILHYLMLHYLLFHFLTLHYFNVAPFSFLLVDVACTILMLY